MVAAELSTALRGRPDAGCGGANGYLSVLGMGGLVYHAMGNGFRALLLLTVVLVFVQFLVLLRRFS